MLCVEKLEPCFAAVQFLTSLTENANKCVTGLRQHAIDDRETHVLRRKWPQTSHGSSSTHEPDRHRGARECALSKKEKQRVRNEEYKIREGNIRRKAKEDRR